jgi:3-hydroxybutyryl-CoA dehydrogenase
MDIHKIAVIGAGNMKHQIALSATINGVQIKCTDIATEILEKATKFANDYLKERVSKGKLTEAGGNDARKTLPLFPQSRKPPVLLYKEIYGFLVNRFLPATRP